MALYGAMVKVTLSKTYELYLEREAQTAKEAGEGLVWEAMGYDQGTVDALLNANPHLNSLLGQGGDAELHGKVQEIEDGEEIDEADYAEDSVTWDTPDEAQDEPNAVVAATAEFGPDDEL